MTHHAYRFFCGLAVWPPLISAAYAAGGLEWTGNAPTFAASAIDPGGPINNDFQRGACWAGYTVMPNAPGFANPHVTFDIEGKQYTCPLPVFSKSSSEQPKKDGQ